MQRLRPPTGTHQPYELGRPRRRASVVCFLLLFATVLAARADYTAVVDPAQIVVTNFDGWGTSLCWWANVAGGYANRATYADLAFTQLKLNIVRYNIGGGENPGLTNSITNYRAIMQGFEPTSGVWNWNADQNQRWMMRAALARGANRVEAFANSPPWWMTVSGSVTGSVGGTNNNLQVGYENAFAGYLASVVSNLSVLDGVHFDFVTPLNEPSQNWWTYANGKQEGCHISPDQQARLVNDLRAELNARASQAGIDAAEDYSESSSLNDVNAYTASTAGNLGLLSTHTYSANNPGGLQALALSVGRPLWVAEYGDGDATGLTMARRIHDDLTGLRARAWVYWQFVDNAGGWGCLYNPLTTNSSGGFTTSYTINQKFYVLGQFSQFIRPGCEIISAGDTNTLAAYDPGNKNLTLVILNTGTTGFNVTYDLRAFSSVPASTAVYQTASGETLAVLPTVPVTNRQFTAAVPAQSVTTFVLTNVSLAPRLIRQSPVTYTNQLSLFAGANPVFSLAAVGSGQLAFQWLSNGVPVNVGTNASYSLRLTSAGSPLSFACVVSNLAGAVTSTVWTVSVLPPPFESYAQAVLALHPVDYWRLNEGPNDSQGNRGSLNLDYVGGNNGIYSNAVLAQPGYNPVAAPAAVAAQFGSVLPTNSLVGQIATVDFATPGGSNAEFSIAVWVKANAQTMDAGILTKGYGGGGEQFNLDTGSDSLATHGYRFFVRDVLGAAHTAASSLMPDGRWHHLVGVCDEAHGFVRLYVDGVDRADGTVPAGAGLLAVSAGSLAGASLVSIGSRTGSKTAASFNNQFVGTIDEAAFYSYALSASQVQALYAAAPVPALGVARSGAGTLLTYTGSLRSSTNVAGPYSLVPGAASPFALLSDAPQVFYRASNP